MGPQLETEAEHLNDKKQKRTKGLRISEIAREFHPAQVRVACLVIKSSRLAPLPVLSPPPQARARARCAFIAFFRPRMWKFRFLKFVEKYGRMRDLD